MPTIDEGLARLSDNLLFTVTLLYSVAMLLYAAEWAFGQRSRRATAGRPRVDRREPALVGAAPPDPPAVPAFPRRDIASADVSAAEPAGGDAGVDGRLGGRIGMLAVAVTGLAWLLHVGSLVTRGLATDRVPWGNMYEFTSALALAAVTAFLVLLARQPVRYLGAFVLLPVVAILGLGATALYTEAGPLVPALNSYWLRIHVSAAVLAFGVFLVAAVATVLFLLRSRHDRRVTGSGREAAASGLSSGLGRRLPSAATLESTAHRLVVFAFPIWTFAVIAGAIWAEAAWGRYWGWDPKETWSLISWVAYAAYLHARATPGWRGTRAAGIGLMAFAAMLFNYFGVNMWIVGLHSYAGLN